LRFTGQMEALGSAAVVSLKALQTLYAVPRRALLRIISTECLHLADDLVGRFRSVAQLLAAPAGGDLEHLPDGNYPDQQQQEADYPHHFGVNGTAANQYARVGAR